MRPLNAWVDWLDKVGHKQTRRGNLWFKEAIKIQEKILGTDHPDMATLLNNLGQTYADAGNPKEAKSSRGISENRINSLVKITIF